MKKIFLILCLSIFGLNSQTTMAQYSVASSNLQYNLNKVKLNVITTEKDKNQDKSNLKLGTLVCVTVNGTPTNGMVTGKSIIDKYFDAKKHTYTITYTEGSKKRQKKKMKASEINYVGKCVETYTEKPSHNLPSNVNIRAMEKAIIKEVNIVRQNPKAYALALEKLAFKTYGSKRNSAKYIAIGKDFLSVCYENNNSCIAERMKKLQVVINYLKRAKPLPILKENTKLAKAAELLAADKGTINGPDHLDSKGRDPWARSKVTGYKGTRGECLNAGHISPAGFIISFLTSPGHRDILMKKEINEIGVDLALHGSGEQRYLRDVIMVGKSSNTNITGNTSSTSTTNQGNSNEWLDLRYISFELKRGESIKGKEMVMSSNQKYLLYLNKDNIPELGRVVSRKRQEELELVKTKTVYIFPVVRASWLRTDEIKFFLQKSDGNLQYANPNKQYWGMTDGRDKNRVILYKVDKLIVTDDGRIVLLDKNRKELWAHK